MEESPNISSSSIEPNSTFNTPYLVWQAQPQGTWSYYGQLPVPRGVHIVAAATGLGNQSNQQVICLGQDGVPYTAWQNNHTGA